MSDQLERFIFSGHDIRGQVVTLTESYRAVLENNQLPPPVARVLGEFLAAACLLSTTLKFEGLLSLQARGNGDVPLILAECTHHSDLRGIARVAEGAQIDDGASLRQLMGSQGALAITIEPQDGERYQGIVPLEKDTLAECLEDYFAQSEQLATRFWIESSPHTVGGIMLQILPGNNAASEAENRDAWETAQHLAETVTAEELHSLPHDQLLHRLFHELRPSSLGTANIRFKCSCSRERSARALIALGPEEVYTLLEEQGGEITADCQFCNTRYQFDREQIETLFNAPPPTLH
ncbi:Hsp33 family molecular chaperone HslO [Microbulbifer thermotolerans]|uniref:33 kDa chaperonin n=1 Tax=Microbulbifer thermotolerans TaxID=252514 RepID=A0A143HPZ6_MICTH|nr:Hsp33 family molecular chaperone HslO [Microbulbifer thermotolerans]AMX03758.1 molecular chaperone Hsp33 [Microbulbifer thermotolerans]MCX2780699.1 Hsp33 family molecular chaperone HslO [Microbulbifer thermotolerans]MCX2783575.1 Hsp33 family molecular chaperone HslO [Microbulbifer thermotolerans]MCX2795786.1 Hsp33 family molecular chaperone HslO [Microbulbifer thermotolerans]MCX2801950.1 Hsp33 family molecular chaperone HslO [Microbulbifer thermotolerans]